MALHGLTASSTAPLRRTLVGVPLEMLTGRPVPLIPLYVPVPRTTFAVPRKIEPVPGVVALRITCPTRVVSVIVVRTRRGLLESTVPRVPIFPDVNGFPVNVPRPTNADHCGRTRTVALMST